MPDVLKLLRDLELRAVGLDDDTKKMQEGYFTAFRPLGLPIHQEDFQDPYTPGAINYSKPVTEPLQQGGSASLDENAIRAAAMAKSQHNYLRTFLLTDSKLQMDNRYTVIPGSSKVSDSWFAIITGAQGRNPSFQLPPDEQAKLDAAMAKLVDDSEQETPKYKRYKTYKEKYDETKRKLSLAIASCIGDEKKTAEFPITGMELYDAVSAAWNEWEGLGSKSEIEEALSTIGAKGMDPSNALIVRAKQRYHNSLLAFPGIGQIPYTLILPRTWYDRENDDGWYEYSSHQFHHASQVSASSTAFGAGGGFHAGLWSGGASFEYADSKAGAEVQMSNLSLRLKYCIADIHRPWLDTTLLNLRNWFLVGDHKKDCISTGRFGQHVPTGGVEPLFLPSLTVSMIFVKDVEIYWDNWKLHWDQHRTTTSAAAAVGVFFFTAQAHYARAEEERNFECHAEGEKLRVPGIQLIGYVSAINPASPPMDTPK